ncbi:hypothetical protein [Streptomyces chartreusis]
MGVSSKDIRQLLKKLHSQGFEVEETKDNHYRVRKDGVYVTTLASTPSESRGYKNALAALKRHGFVK